MPLDQIDVESPTTEVKEMTFLEHLEELRWHLIRSGIAILVIGVVVFIAKDFVFRVVIFGPTSPDFLTYNVICRTAALWEFTSGMCLRPPAFMFVTPVFGKFGASSAPVCTKKSGGPLPGWYLSARLYL